MGGHAASLGSPSRSPQAACRNVALAAVVEAGSGGVDSHPGAAARVLPDVVLNMQRGVANRRARGMELLDCMCDTQLLAVRGDGLPKGTADTRRTDTQRTSSSWLCGVWLIRRPGRGSGRRPYPKRASGAQSCRGGGSQASYMLVRPFLLQPRPSGSQNGPARDRLKGTFCRRRHPTMDEQADDGQLLDLTAACLHLLGPPEGDHTRYPPAADLGPPPEAGVTPPLVHQAWLHGLAAVQGHHHPRALAALVADAGNSDGLTPACVHR